MTVIVSVKINDGIVMASDSASTILNSQIYLNADKIVNLIKDKPIGAMVTGDGGIGRSSISTLLKDLRVHLMSGAENGLDPERCSVEQVVRAARGFFQRFLATEEMPPVGWVMMRICGYSAGRSLPEVWQLVLTGTACSEPVLIQGEESFGPQCEGQFEAYNRLVVGFSPRLKNIMNKLSIDTEKWEELGEAIRSETMEPFVAPAMPIQDAIDLARFLVEMTIGFVRFSIRVQPKGVGGLAEIATITKHEGFKWVQTRNFYPDALNLKPNSRST